VIFGIINKASENNIITLGITRESEFTHGVKIKVIMMLV
jgi:hypothetical protein